MLDGMEHCHDAAASSQQPISSVSCIELYHKHDRGLPVVLLIDGLALWRILMTYYALAVKESQHHFHLAPNLLCFLGLRVLPL